MTDKYAVFGNPIAHTRSPMIHQMFAEQAGQQMEYASQLVEENNFTVAADDFFLNGGKGLNVTVPFKLDAFDQHDKVHCAQQTDHISRLVKPAPHGAHSTDRPVV